MEVAVTLDRRLPAGTAVLPAGSASGTVRMLRLGTAAVPLHRGRGGPLHEVRLAPDLFSALAVPLDGLRLDLRVTNDGSAIFGPAVAVLYAGKADELKAGDVRERLSLFFGWKQGASGLFALGFDESIDWDDGVMEGYVLDNRPGAEGAPVRTRFPIPAAVHLRWAINREVIARLRERTDGRVFNWVRNMSKWQFHQHLANVPDLAPHLPETRLLGAFPDLAGMLVRHGTVFVKQVFGIKGKGAARVRLAGADGYVVSYVDQGRMQERQLPVDADVVKALRELLGPGRLVVQQGLDLTGRRGRKLDFRILVVREGRNGWSVVHRHAKVAPDDQLAFLNVSIGAEEADTAEALHTHTGLGAAAIAHVTEEMDRLSLRAAEALTPHLDPVGILGIDVALDMPSGQIYLLEANTVPGWGYPDAVEAELARRMAQFALSLAEE